MQVSACERRWFNASRPLATHATVVAVGLQRDPQQFPDVGVVVDDQDGAAMVSGLDHLINAAALSSLTRARASHSTVLTISDGAAGLATCIWKPADSARRRSSVRASAVSAHAGVAPPDCCVQSADVADQREAVFAGQHQIAQQHVGRIALEVAPALRSARTRSPRPRPAARACRARNASCCGSSSTTSTETPRSDGRGAERGGFGTAADASISRIGRRTSNVEPALSPPLEAETLPPCSSTTCRTMPRPRPRPPCSRVELASPCRKRSNRCAATVRRKADAGVAHGESHLRPTRRRPALRRRRRAA